MKIIVLTLIYWIKIKVYKYSYSNASATIELQAWRGAKKDYDRLSKKLSVNLDEVKRLKKYLGVKIEKAHGEREGKSSRWYRVIKRFLQLTEGILIAWGLSAIFNYGPLSDLTDPADWIKLLVTSVVITIATTLLPAILLIYLNNDHLNEDKVRYGIPEEPEKRLVVMCWVFAVMAILGAALTASIGYERGIDGTNGSRLWFFVLSPVFVAMVAAVCDYLANKSGIRYDAYKAKERYLDAINKHEQEKRLRAKLKKDLADKFASDYMCLIIKVKHWLKMDGNPVFPKDHREFRLRIEQEFEKTACEELNREGAPGQPGMNFGAAMFLLLGASIFFGSCKPEKSYEVRVLMDVSGSTSAERWTGYKQGLYNLLLAYGQKGHVVVYPIDAESYSNPNRLFEFDTQSGMTDQPEIAAIIEKLPDTLRPPFKRRGEWESWEQVGRTRIKPFLDKIWPTIDKQLDQIAAERLRYGYKSNIIGAIKNLANEMSGAGEESQVSWTGQRKSKEYWLFIFSDMVHSEKSGISFEKPFGITPAQSKTLLSGLKADNQIPDLEKVKVVAIGKGLFKGGPVTDEAIDNIQLFWQEFFRKAQAELVTYESLDKAKDLNVLVR